MGNNEIRLRKQKLSTGKIARHRNYAELLRKHKRGLKTRHLIIVLIYSIIVFVILSISIMLIRTGKKKVSKNVGYTIGHSATPLPVKTPLTQKEKRINQ